MTADPATTPLSPVRASESVDPALRRLLAPFWVGLGLDRERDPERFKRLTAMALLASADLEVISVWNPSFLTVHLELIAAREEMVRPSRRFAPTTVGAT